MCSEKNIEDQGWERCIAVNQRPAADLPAANLIDVNAYERLHVMLASLPDLWRRVWPFAGLAMALLVNVVWVGALGYALIWLL